jgi:protein-S-isoprenylcysteine O-methyltransferase Ste14
MDLNSSTPATRPVGSGGYTLGAQAPSRPADRTQLTRMQLAAEVALRMTTAAVLSLFVISAVQQYLKDTSRITLIIFAVSGVLTVGLAIISRVPLERDWNPFSLAVTLCGTFYFLAFRVEPGIRLVPEFCAAGVQVLGVIIQIYAKCSLRRSFGLLPANRGVICLGPYRVIRHPMYLGYMVTDLGFLLANFGFWNVIVLFVQWSLQVGRIIQEERLLAKDDAYRRYISRVRYRLIFRLF